MIPCFVAKEMAEDVDTVREILKLFCHELLYYCRVRMTWNWCILQLKKRRNLNQFQRRRKGSRMKPLMTSRRNCKWCVLLMLKQNLLLLFLLYHYAFLFLLVT